MMDNLQLSEAETIAVDTKIELAKVEEALAVRDLIKGMDKSVKPGSMWYLVSNEWIKAWNNWVGFDAITTSGERDLEAEPPGPVTSDDLLDTPFDMLWDKHPK